MQTGKQFVLGVSTLLLSLTAMAADGPIKSITLDPAEPKVGQSVQVTVAADAQPSTFCGLYVDFGDGDTRQIKIDSGKNTTFPQYLTKTYQKAGSYTIKASGKRITTHLPCPGKVEKTVMVADAPGAKPAAASTKSAAPLCPEGYTQAGKVAKNGSFKCNAGKNAQPPSQPLSCPDGLSYVHNKRFVGCQKL